MRAFWLVLLLIFAGCDVNTSNPRYPKPPPEGYAQLGRNPTYRDVRLKTPAEVDAYCRANGVDAQDEHRQTKIEACVIPSLQEVVLPRPFPAALERAEARKIHEYGHTWGLTHKGDDNWYDRTGKRVDGITPEQGAALLSMAQTAAELQVPRLPGSRVPTLSQPKTQTGFVVPRRP